MLLSCTVAMGADTTDTEEVGLNITNNGSRIKVDKVFPDNTLKGNTYTNKDYQIVVTKNKIITTYRGSR